MSFVISKGVIVAFLRSLADTLEAYDLEENVAVRSGSPVSHGETVVTPTSPASPRQRYAEFKYSGTFVRARVSGPDHDRKFTCNAPCGCVFESNVGKDLARKVHSHECKRTNGES